METNKCAVFAFCLIGFAQFVLLLLKAMNIIQWNWIWVIAPMWIPYIVSLVAGITMIIYVLLLKIKERNYKKHE